MQAYDSEGFMALRGDTTFKERYFTISVCALIKLFVLLKKLTSRETLMDLSKWGQHFPWHVLNKAASLIVTSPVNHVTALLRRLSKRVILDVIKRN